MDYLLEPNYSPDEDQYYDAQLARFMQLEEERIGFASAPSPRKVEKKHAVSVTDLTANDEQIARVIQQEEKEFQNRGSKQVLNKTMKHLQTKYDELVALQLQRQEGKTELQYLDEVLATSLAHTAAQLMIQQNFPEAEEGNIRQHDVSESYEELLELGEKIGVVSRGLSEKDLEALPVRTFNSAVSKQNSSCAICKEDYRQNEKLRTLQCFHSFHCNCIDRWLSTKKTCPVCLKEVHEQRVKKRINLIQLQYFTDVTIWIMRWFWKDSCL